MDDLFGGLPLPVASLVNTCPPAPIAAAIVRTMVPARSVTEDGACVIEFDARPWLEQCDEESLQLLIAELFQGAGPGCRRLMENASADTRSLLAYAELAGVAWSARLDLKPAYAWVETHRPFLSRLLSTEALNFY